MQHIIPYLLYEDVGRALQWLADAFGFRETGERMTTPEGRINHAAMEFEGELIMMGCPGPQYKSPKRLGQVTQNLYVNVRDIDRHYERARAAGAEILQPLQNMFYGDRRYGAADPEGHHWYFAEPIGKSGGKPSEQQGH